MAGEHIMDSVVCTLMVEYIIEPWPKISSDNKPWNRWLIWVHISPMNMKTQTLSINNIQNLKLSKCNKTSLCGDIEL